MESEKLEVIVHEAEKEIAHATVLKPPPPVGAPHPTA